LRQRIRPHRRFPLASYPDLVNGESEPRVRLAELVGALSLGVDLGFGQPMEHVLRQCLIGLRLAERLGLDDAQRATVYYVALLVNVGCHADAHEQAKWFGDDIAMKSGKYDYEFRSLRGAASAMRMIGSGSPVLQRFRIGLEFAIVGHRDVDEMITQHAMLARSLAEQLGLSEAVLDALAAAYETWDGKGWPGKLEAEEIPIAARIAQLAEFAEVADRAGGSDAVVSLADRRSGRQCDPRLSRLLREDPDGICERLDEIATWDAVIGAEPALVPLLSGDRLDEALLAVANFVDLKSPYTLGHSAAVARLAGAAASELGLSAEDARTVYRAAVVHGLGRLGISNSIWDKRGPLGPGEWERVRIHPYLTERMLQQSPALSPLGRIAVQHRERLDGSGYPRRLAGSAIEQSARIIGVADAYQAMTEFRPYREPLKPDEAARELRREVSAGRLDSGCVDAVLSVAGHRVPLRREGPAGLTRREIEVLCLLARGQSNKEIARELVISPKTVGNHVEHIYAKIDASNRAGASLFAVRHGLLPEPTPGLKMGKTPHVAGPEAA
jgi:HD-GYP domain-containing protein (c-di-GMP phosphodiesterase class II)